MTHEVSNIKPQGENLPAFLQNVSGDADGTELLGQYVKPPRIKIVQPQSGATLKASFNEGDVICTPQNIIVSPVVLNEKNRPTDKGNPFFFVPLFFYPEFCCWNPIQMKGTLPVIRERSLDSKSEIALKAKNFNAREELCIEDINFEKEGRAQYRIKYVEHMNFVVMLMNHELFGTPLVLSFSRGSYKDGCNFSATIKMRRKPIYACQFQASVSQRTSTKAGDSYWFGWDIVNPPPSVQGVSPWVEDEQLFLYFQEQHEYFKAIYNDGILVADYDENDFDAGTVDASATVPQGKF